MPPTVATIAFVIVICGLFVLDRDRRWRASSTLWLPAIALLFSASRSPSEWLETFGLSTPQPFSSPDRFLDGTPLDRNVLLCLMGLSLAILAARRRRVSALLRQNRILLLFVLYCGLSVLWSDYPFVAFKRWVKSLSDIVFVFVILTESPEAFGRILTRLSFILVPLSVLLVKYHPDIGRRYDIWSATPITIGISTTKNEFAAVCLICGLVSLWALFTVYADKTGGGRSRRLCVHGAVLGMVTWLLVTADSMTGLASFVAAGAILTLTSCSRAARSRYALPILVLAALGATGFAVFWDSDGWLTSAVGRDPTLTGRTNIWKAVLASHGDPLLGTGYESFWTGPRLYRIWDSTMPGLNQAHNGYLEVYLNLGIIGVLLLGCILHSGYRNVRAGLRSGQTDARLAFAVLIGALIFNFTEAAFRETTLVWMCVLYAVCRGTAAAPSASHVPAASQIQVAHTARPRLAAACSPPARTH